MRDYVTSAPPQQSSSTQTFRAGGANGQLNERGSQVAAYSPVTFQSLYGSVRVGLPLLNRPCAGLRGSDVELAAGARRQGVGPEEAFVGDVQSYTFSGGVASVAVMGKKIGEKWPYTVEGKKITLKGPSGDVVLTTNDDGSLSDPANDKLAKK